MTREEAIYWIDGLLCAYEGCEHGYYFYDNGDEVCRAAEVALAALRDQPRWISVKERLPERYASVLVCTECGEVGEAIKSEWAKSGWAWSGYDGEDIEGKVTHWMPLPEPPEVEG